MPRLLPRLPLHLRPLLVLLQATGRLLPRLVPLPLEEAAEGMA